ncbi:MAG: hypothetical protein HC767_00510 [Akkermansiaceae bacterium]|nr:hypothetical protein [Akkermansiaceae bacterium]
MISVRDRFPIANPRRFIGDKLKLMGKAGNQSGLLGKTDVSGCWIFAGLCSLVTDPLPRSRERCFLIQRVQN